MEKKLSKRASAVLARSDRSLFVSVVSIWEVLMKRHLNKVMIDEDPVTIVNTISTQDIWSVLPLNVHHIQGLNEIARFTDHADPFDRMLIAQAHSEGLRIITADEQFSRYNVDVVW